jgi:hypothetical protein
MHVTKKKITVFPQPLPTPIITFSAYHKVFIAIVGKQTDFSPI